MAGQQQTTSVVRYLATLALAAMACVAGGGCNEIGFPQVFETAHFRYHVQEGKPAPCETTAGALEHIYQALASFLRVPEAPERKIDYYLYPDVAAASAACGGVGTSCADRATVRSSHPVNEHELVHAVASFIGYPPYLFQEGLADMLTEQGRDFPGQRTDPSEPIEDLTTTRTFAAWVTAHGFHIYASAAKLVRYLHDRYGVEAFLSFYRTLATDADSGAISAAARASFGLSMEEIFADWRTLAPTYPDENRLHVIPCGAPALAAGLPTPVPLVCGRSGIGAEATFHFVAGDRPTRLQIDGGPVDISLSRCQGGTLTWLPTKLSDNDPDPLGARLVLDVPPGDYFAALRTPAVQTFAVQQQAGDQAGVDSCRAEHAPIDVSAGYPVIIARRWRAANCGGSSWCPGLAWDIQSAADGRLSPTGLRDELPKTLFACQEPCPAAPATDCMSFPFGVRPITVPATAGTTIHLAVDDSPNDPFFVMLLRLLPVAP